MATITISQSSHLANPIASIDQLSTSASQLDSLPKDLFDSIRFESARLLQAAGILLRLPQDLIAQAIVILYRFWQGPDGGSLVEHHARDVAAAALYLSAKPSGHSVTPRQLLTVFSHLNSTGRKWDKIALEKDTELDPEWQFPTADYESARTELYAIEAHILRVLAFDMHVALPYTLCVNYLQTLDLFSPSSPKGAGTAVAKRAVAHLNTALLSPQLLYLTHQPTALATAAIYLAAREVGVSLPDVEWWEIFDVDREMLGFLVVAMLSMDGFVLGEKRRWGKREVPLTVEGLQAELERRKLMEDGE